VRTIVARLEHDRALSPDIEALSAAMRDDRWAATVMESA
jgi:histidine ammonia-lyase